MKYQENLCIKMEVLLSVNGMEGYNYFTNQDF